MYHCPLVRRARLILNKMPALSILVLMTTLLPCPSAQAGSWSQVVTSDNTSSTFKDNGVWLNLDTYSHFSPGSSSYTINRPSGGSSGIGCNIHAVIHVQVTFTWQPASGQTMTTDPPPPNVKVLESGTAFWSASSGDEMRGGSVSGQVVNGLGDARYDPPNDLNHNPPIIYQTAYKGVGYSGPQPDQSYPSPVPTLVQHFQDYPSSSGTVTVSQRTVTADANTTSPNWYYGAKASVSYGAYIHAQPYNFHQTNVTDNGDGTLAFTYFWLSTSGNLSDLDPNCVVHEYVTYQGGNPYYPPAPFTVAIQGIPNPTITPTPKNPGSAGFIVDNQLFRGSSSLDVVQPYQLAYFSATQTWEFDDSATGETNKKIPGPDSGPLSINRNIGPRPPYIPYWWYSVTKNGTTAWTQLPNQ